MAAEGRRLVERARERGVTLRLIGGLAVLDHCVELAFCGRDHSDLDMVGLSRQVNELAEVLAHSGYAERLHVRVASTSSQAQFVRPCRHLRSDRAGTLHDDDHVDVFLDVFRMDHTIDLRRRLELDPYTVSASDLLLSKLQVFRAEPHDVRDMLTLLKDLELADDDGPGMLNVSYIAQACARDWGLFYDVSTNLRRSREAASEDSLDAGARGRVDAAVARLLRALDEEPKPLSWRLRAKVGTRRPWHAEVEEQDGAPA